MKTTSTLILAALAAVAQAAQFTNVVVNPEPNKPFELTWSDAQGPVTILLKNGPSGNLVTIDTLAANIAGDSVSVTLNAADLASDIYAFEIVDASGANYSQQFSFQGTGTPSSTSASATGSTTGSATTESSKSSATPSHSSNSSTGTVSRTSSSTASGTASGRPSRTSSVEDEEPIPESSGRNLSPLALIFVTAAAMMYFN